MKRRKIHRRTLIVINVVLLAIISASVGVMAGSWNSNVPEALTLPTYAPTASPTAFLPSEDIEQVTEPGTVTVERAPRNALVGIEIAPSPTPLPAGQPEPEPLCGGPPVMNILAVGVDNTSEEYQYGLADEIRIARVDFVTPKVTVLAIPRDVWVQIPEISDHYGITAGKINQAYFYGTSAMGYYDGPGEGSGLMALTLAKNFGLYVGRYGAVNMGTLADMIDAVGGVDIYLPKDVDGTLQGMGYFRAGQQHFTGEEAILYARIRYPDSDLRRIDRQSEVLYALQEKVLSVSVLPRLPKLISAFSDAVVTDLSAKEISSLTCLLPQITQDRLVFAQIPPEFLTSKMHYDPARGVNTWTFQADFDAIRALMGHFQEGTWPAR